MQLHYYLVIKKGILFYLSFHIPEMFREMAEFRGFKLEKLSFMDAQRTVQRIYESKPKRDLPSQDINQIADFSLKCSSTSSNE